MKSIYNTYVKVLIVLLILITNSLYAQVGIGTTAPNESSALDIRSTNTGLLIPRVTLSSTLDTGTITGTEAVGLLVFNTITISDVTQGFYYWDGGKWVGVKSSASTTGSEDDWTTLGNNGTNDAINYIGTNDSEDLVFKGNGNEYMRLSWDTGFFGINTSAAEEYLDVNGDIDFGGGSLDWDSDGENLHFRARSEEWFAAATNSSSIAGSSFYISTTQQHGQAQFLIANNGNVNIGSDNEYEPLDMLHVTNDDENITTTIRIDNTGNANSIMHTALELWDGSSTSSTTTGLQAFFRHNNKDHILEIGQAKSDGTVNFYSGKGSGSSSDITLVLDKIGQVGVGSDLENDTPEDMLHVAKDQNTTTTIRIDNTNTGGSEPHTSFELWDGGSTTSSNTGLQAFFRHTNGSHVLDIGHSKDDGIVNFYSGDGTGDTSSISMTLENDGHVTIQSVMNLNPGSAPSSPAKGDIYYDSSDDKVKVYTGAGWSNLN